MSIKAAIKALQAGGVIAFPTDTVFGIGALLNQPAAIWRIYRIKKRPKSKPLQVLVSSLRQAKELGIFDDKALKLAKKHWPGALTIIVAKTSKVPASVTAGKKTVGLRIPAHRTIIELIRKCGPLAATSANISEELPALNIAEVKKNLPGLDHYLPGRVKKGCASRVIDTTAGNRILRR